MSKLNLGWKVVRMEPFHHHHSGIHRLCFLYKLSLPFSLLSDTPFPCGHLTGSAVLTSFVQYNRYWHLMLNSYGNPNNVCACADVAVYWGWGKLQVFMLDYFANLMVILGFQTTKSYMWLAWLPVQPLDITITKWQFSINKLSHWESIHGWYLDSEFIIHSFMPNCFCETEMENGHLCSLLITIL